MAHTSRTTPSQALRGVDFAAGWTSALIGIWRAVLENRMACRSLRGPGPGSRPQTRGVLAPPASLTHLTAQPLAITLGADAKHRHPFAQAALVTRALFYCALTYLAAIAAGSFCAHWLAGYGWHPVWIALAADVVATLVVFGFSVAFDNSSMYDPYWSVAPPVLGVFFALQPTAASADRSRQLLVLTLVMVWSIRLTHNFLRGWQGLAHEDWRYVDIRRNTGRAYWLVSLLGVHLVPTLMVFVGCLPLYAALAIGARPLNTLDAVAAALCVAAIAIEATADNQLRRFKLNPDRRPGEIFASGIWAWSRHPNYFGEMLFWWGLFVFALAANPSEIWPGVGALAITILFRFISLRLIDARMLARRPEYAEHMRNRPAFIPWPPRAKRLTTDES